MYTAGCFMMALQDLFVKVRSTLPVFSWFTLDSRFRGNRAPEMVRDQGGGSPPQTYALRFEADCNCVPVREGGEQQKANGQSVTKVNSIRPTCMMSQLIHGEIQTADRTSEEALNAEG